MPDFWERLDGESPQAFEAFAAYRDMGADRSLSKVARHLGKSKSLLDRWSVQHHWVNRSDAWDIEADRLHRGYLIAHRRDVDRRLLGIAGAMQAKMVEALRQLDASTLTARDMAAWLTATTAAQRAALGLGEKIEVTGADGGPIELSGLSPAEAASRLAEIAAEIRRRLEDNPLAVASARADLDEEDEWGPDPEPEQETGSEEEGSEWASAPTDF
jgi:hypothetical protein